MNRLKSRPLLAFGEALIDLLQDRREPARFHRNAGGAPANVAVGFARLGGASRFMGMLSADGFGVFLRAELASLGVDLRHVRTTGQANTALAVVSLAADGERSFNFYRPPAADLLFRAADIDPAAFDGQPWLHFCSNSLTHDSARGATLALLDQAATAGCPISFDVNLRPALWPVDADPRALVARLLPRAHLLKFSREEWDWLAADRGDAALAAHCFAGSTVLIVVTDGAAPVRTRLRGHGWTVHPVAPVQVVDSTAAGDAFIAGLLYQLALADAGPGELAALLAQPARLPAWIDFASRCGAHACGRFGAFAALPAMADVSRQK